MNELVSLDRKKKKNESTVEKFAKEYDIARSWKIEACPNSNNLDLLKIVDFGQSLMFL